MRTTRIERVLQDMLVPVTGSVDVGVTDEDIQQVSVWVTPSYAGFLAGRRGRDVRIMQRQPTAFSSVGPGKFAVQELIGHAVTTVQNLIEAGVPANIALRFLPHEVYLEVSKPRRLRKSGKRTKR